MPNSLLALLDDIATLLDDVVVLSKIAAKKTAGVLGDDLALNAQQVTGVTADRELPVVWAVAKGSMVNKAILVPAALVISGVAPWGVTPLLMLGGAFLCFEGFEKLAHKLAPGADKDAKHEEELKKAAADPAVDLVAFEKDKIKGAVRTDFILSAEIVAITLGTVAASTFATRVAVLVGISVVMTIGVYGLVAAIVKLDDLGLSLSRRGGAASLTAGRAILRAAPYMMKGLSVAGTAAMFLVGGGILVHGIPPLHHWVESVVHAAAAQPGWGVVAGALSEPLLNGAAGLIAGAIALGAVLLGKRAVARLRGRGGAKP